MYPENSIEAFVWSAKSGFDEIEFDLHMSADGGVVVFHDLVAQHTANGEGHIGDMTLTELKRMTLRGSGETIPSFDDLLAAVARHSIGLRIELKRNREKRPYPAMLGPVAAGLDRHGLTKRAVITAFEPDALVDFAEAGFPTGIWYDRIQRPEQPDLIDWLPELARRGIRDVAIHTHEYTADRYRAARDLNFRLGIWTVNGPARLDYWLRQPFEFLVTDQPDLASAILAGISNTGD